MLAEATAAAVLALAALPPVLANAAAAALLARAAHPPVLADAAATALLALAALPPVLAEAAAAALLALAALPPVRTGHETHRARESSRISGSKQLAGFVKFASTPLKITRQRFEPRCTQNRPLFNLCGRSTVLSFTPCCCVSFYQLSVCLTTLVVRGLGRAFLCLSVCLSVCLLSVHVRVTASETRRVSASPSPTKARPPGSA